MHAKTSIASNSIIIRIKSSLKVYIQQLQQLRKKTVRKKIIKFRNNWYLISSMVVGHSLLLARLPGTH